MTTSPPPGEHSDSSGTDELDPAALPNGEIEVREARTAQEMEQVYVLRDAVFVAEQDLTDNARDDPEDGHSIHLLAFMTDDPQAVGTGRVTLYGREAQVAWVAVRRDRRRQGIGDAIMRELIAHSRDAGAAFVSLNAQSHAIPFYNQLGFESISGEFRMGGIPHRVMTLRLT